jgi:hypothetical protein
MRHAFRCIACGPVLFVVACASGAGEAPRVATPVETSRAPSVTASASSRPTAISKAPTSASTVVTTDGGQVVVRGLDGFANHSHGGPPATLGHCRFQVTNRGKRTATVRVEGVEFLSGHSCDLGPDTVRARPSPKGVSIDDERRAPGGVAVRVTPDTSRDVTVFLSPTVEASSTHCDRFAFRIHLRIDGASVQVVAETHVQREDDPDR